MKSIDRAVNNPFSLPKAREDYMRHRLTAVGNGAIRPNMKKGAFLFTLSVRIGPCGLCAGSGARQAYRDQPQYRDPARGALPLGSGFERSD